MLKWHIQIDVLFNFHRQMSNAYRGPTLNFQNSSPKNYFSRDILNYITK